MGKRAGVPSLFDRALATVGLQRAPRAASGIGGTRASARPRASVYRAAQHSRLTEDWFSSILSADWELKGDLRRLRGVARALGRDNGFGSRYLQMLAENVIGPHGIRMQARAINARRGLNTRLNQQIEDAWAEWSYPENASIDGKLSWVDIQALFIQNIAQDGEALIRLLPGADNPFHFALQVLDPDLLDETYNVYAPQSRTGNEIRMGVELNAYRKPVAYWLWTEHPSEYGRVQQRTRVPAEEIIHAFIVKRPDQTRGVTWFAPVMFDTEMLQGLQEAELTAARVGAANMAAIEYDPDKGDGGADDEDEDSYDEDGVIPTEVSPGLFMRLRPGEKLTGTQFNHPNTAFDPFVKSIQRSIATGLNVAYTSLTGDLAAVNYSSIRSGLLSERDFYRRLQQWTATVLHRRVYQAWAPMAALGGWFSATEARGKERILWQPRGWKWVDPLNDLTAAALAISLGLDTRTALCAEQGRDFEENLEMFQQEEQLIAEYGVTLGAGEPSSPAKKSTLPTDDTGNNTSDAGEPGDEGDTPDQQDQQARQQRRRIAGALRLALTTLERSAA